MFSYIILIATILFGCYMFVHIVWCSFKRFSSTDGLTYLPGDFPIFGHVLMLRDRDNFNENKEKWYLEYGEMFGLYFMFNRVVFTRNPAICEDLLSNQKYNPKGVGYSLIEKFLGNGLVTSKGELWKKRRKMITPAFHFNILNDFVSVMESKTFDLIEYLQKHSRNEEQTVLDIFKITKPFSMSIICDTAMGLDLTLEETSSGRFTQLYESVVLLLYRRHLEPWLQYDFIYYWTRDWNYFKTFQNHLTGFVREIIETRLESRSRSDTSNSSAKRRIFIDVLLDAYEKGEIDVEGILDEVNTFVNAGYETTSTALAWALYCLGRNPRVQEKLYRELVQVGVKTNTLKELKYLSLVLKETLRLHPVISRLSRAVPKGSVLGGFTFPECSVGIDITAMNRNPEVWENPMEFVPERFENYDENKRSAFIYIPFSAGPRNCIGQRFAMLELKIALYHLIRTFRVTSSQKESELKETFDITHGCEGGLFISFEKRVSSNKSYIQSF